MLSGEGNAGEWWKTTIGLISKKKQLCKCSTLFCTFLCRWFARLQRETSRNFLGNVVRVLVHYIFTAAYFHLALVAANISHVVIAATKISCCSSNKKMSHLFFISRSRPPAPSPFFSLSLASLPPTFSFSRSFSCPIFQVCRHDN